MIVLQVFWISGGCLAFAEGWDKLFSKPLKPFSCASCMSLWVGILAALVCHQALFAFLPYLVTKITMKYLWS